VAIGLQDGIGLDDITLLAAVAAAAGLQMRWLMTRRRPAVVVEPVAALPTPRYQRVTLRPRQPRPLPVHEPDLESVMIRARTTAVEEYGQPREAMPWETIRTDVLEIDAWSIEACCCGKEEHRQLRTVNKSGLRRKWTCLSQGRLRAMIAFITAALVVFALATATTSRLGQTSADADGLRPVWKHHHVGVHQLAAIPPAPSRRRRTVGLTSTEASLAA
jgi:hypothetical protein